MNSFCNKLKISKKDFLFQFQSHPNYPSALAFSDTLNFLNIKNDVYEIDNESWNELPNQYITIYDNKFTIVEKSNDNFLIFNDKENKISKDELINNSENIVFIFNKIEDTSDAKQINYKWIIILLFSFISIYSFIQLKYHYFIYNILSVIGLYISVELFNNKFGGKSIIINKFCSSNKESYDTMNNCNKIFSSDKINILGLKLSDFSIAYFLILIILGTIIKENDFILKCITFSSVLVIAYSLYIQLFIEKIICKICSLIIFILIGQIIIGYLFFNNIFSYDNFYVSFICFVTIFLLVIYINDILKQKQEYYISSLKNLRFKKNYHIFRSELQIKHYKFNTKNEEFLLGNKISKLHISIITNPYCGYCKEVYKFLEKIIKNYPDISIQLRFNYLQDNTDDNLRILISTFRNIYNKQGQKMLFEAINFWHNKNNIEEFKKKYKPFIYETEMSGIIELAEENRNFGLTYTPQILINNYLFSNLYEREDILFFIDELLEDEEILNEKI